MRKQGVEDYRQKLLSHEGWSGDSATGHRGLPAKEKKLTADRVFDRCQGSGLNPDSGQRPCQRLRPEPLVFQNLKFYPTVDCLIFGRVVSYFRTSFSVTFRRDAFAWYALAE